MVAMPQAVGTNRLLVTAGYNVGAALLDFQRNADGAFTVKAAWESKRLKAKFANPYVRDGFVYGLDDGILTCLDLKDGTQRWKEGRHGHGQGLLVGDRFVLMAETGELLLLQPTPDGPDELGRFRVFSDKTWNPVALSGDLLLARNDREAALLRLPRTP
jgi:outer membrane protein assembly factor BamB